MNLAVRSKVRPYVEIVETGNGGLRVAAIVYGDTKELAAERAEVVAEILDKHAMPAALKRRLKQASRYMWARRMHQQARRRGRPTNIYTLIMWLLGCEIEPGVMAIYLRDNFEADSRAQPGGRARHTREEVIL